MDPIVWRGIERLVICLGAIAFAYLGYRLYAIGIKPGRNTTTVESPLLKFALSGTGPGLFFMAFGATVLAIALSTGDARTTMTETTFADNPAGAPQGTIRMMEQTLPSNFDPMRELVSLETSFAFRLQAAEEALSVLHTRMSRLEDATSEDAN